MFYTNIVVCCGIGTSLWPSTGRGSRNEMQGRQWCRASGCRAKTLWTSTENSTIHHNISRFPSVKMDQNMSKCSTWRLWHVKIGHAQDLGTSRIISGHDWGWFFWTGGLPKKGRSSHLNFSVSRWEFRYHRLPMSSKRGWKQQRYENGSLLLRLFPVGSHHAIPTVKYCTKVSVYRHARDQTIAPNSIEGWMSVLLLLLW